MNIKFKHVCANKIFLDFKHFKHYLNEYLLNVRKQWFYRTTLGSIFL